MVAGACISGDFGPLPLVWSGLLPVHGVWVNLVAIPLMTFVVFPPGVIWLLVASLVPALALLLRGYEWEPVAGQDLEMLFFPFPRPKSGLRVRMTARGG